jgi:hypothetical protein
MFRRLVVALAVVSFGLVTEALAQEPVAATLDVAAASKPSFSASPSLVAADQIQRALPAPSFRRPRPSVVMTSLYASTFAMQMLDVHSTLSAFRAGAVEANPLMEGVTRNRAAFFAVKAAVATSTVLAARQLSKRNKVAAIVTLVAINSAYAMVVNHNYQVARGR